MDKLNIYHNNIVDGVRSFMFNEDCPEDLDEYNLFKSFVDPIGDYINSQDKRNHYKTLFKNLLTFYKYDDKQAFFGQYQNLSEKLEQLAPSASSKITVEDEDTMNDETKIFGQSQRIRKLEVVNQKHMEEIEYLRTEREKFIEKDHNSTNTLSDYKKLLEELNSQLHNEIDNVSNKQKEVIRLKNANIECSNIKNQYRSLEDTNNANKKKLSETEAQLSKMKTLNSTIIDKQTEFQQKLVLERNNSKEHQDIIKQLRLDITKYDSNIKELNTEIECEKEQHIISKSKIDKMIADISKSEKVVTPDHYQDILLSQLKEKTEEIKQIQVANTKLSNDIQTSKKKYDLLKSQVSALINK